jgi:UDP-galactopyranose mutase
MKYDYVIVGAGLFGSTFARLATDNGKKCLIIDKRKHIGGNVYTENKDGINIHVYGPHIFHTNSEDIWKFVNRFANFNNYIHQVKARYGEKVYSLPFNMNTFYELWKTITPTAAANAIKKETSLYDGMKGDSLESFALRTVGKTIYERLIKGYTEKQWQRSPRELPSSIIKRIPLRFNYNNNYFNDQYQGIPIGGYTKMMEKMLEGVEVKLNVDYFADKNYWDSIADKVVYTGCIDQYYDYRFGRLEYRTLEFNTVLMPDTDNFQGCAQMNYTDSSVPFTRAVEHKHFEFGTQPVTYVTFEYPVKWREDSIPYYPINDDNNQGIFRQYEQLSKQDKVIFGGRLANYQYYDMHQVIGQAFSIYNKHVRDTNE